MVSKIVVEGSNRFSLLDLLNDNSVGVELGIAEGRFAKRAIKSQKFSHYFGIDVYDSLLVGGGKKHNVDEYKVALVNIGLFTEYRHLRMMFSDALTLFDDNSLDFVYVDGFAHNGELDGATFYDWYPKVKPGGILAGDDYHEDWPLVVKSLETFLKDKGYEEFYLTDPNCVSEERHCTYPSWYIYKK